jgi:hypothetical protein
MGNILVAPDAMDKEYIIGPNRFGFMLTQKILFFDWDLSYVPFFCGQNNALDSYLCDDHGMCNAEGSVKYDMVLFLYSIDALTNDDEFEAFYSEVIDNSLLVSDFSRSCERDTPPDGVKLTKCGRLKNKIGMPEDFPALLPSISEIVQHSYFDDLRV